MPARSLLARIEGLCGEWQLRQSMEAARARAAQREPAQRQAPPKQAALDWHIFGFCPYCFPYSSVVVMDLRALATWSMSAQEPLILDLAPTANPGPLGFVSELRLPEPCRHLVQAHVVGYVEQEQPSGTRLLNYVLDYSHPALRQGAPGRTLKVWRQNTAEAISVRRGPPGILHHLEHVRTAVEIPCAKMNQTAWFWGFILWALHPAAFLVEMPLAAPASAA